MNKKEIISMLSNRIFSCHKDLLYSRNVKNPYAEGFRTRLDELLLMWHQIHNISFIDACKEFDIKYEDVDVNQDGGEK